MELRELINRLEALSKGGKNDHLYVEIENPEDPSENLCVCNAYILKDKSNNSESNYIFIDVG